jgi:hypothetical protein
MFRIRWSVAVVLVCAVGLTGCSKTVATTSEIGGDPAVVTPIHGAGDLHRIQLTADAAHRIGLQTSTVREGKFGQTGSTRELAVAISAVLYDHAGATWVYGRTAPLTFQRMPVIISRVAGDDYVLKSGPAAGTAVATVGVAELRGSEDGVPGE